MGDNSLVEKAHALHRAGRQGPPSDAEIALAVEFATGRLTGLQVQAAMGRNATRTNSSTAAASWAFGIIRRAVVHGIVRLERP